MFRRVGNVLLNLNTVTDIMLWNKTIEYTLVGKRWTAFFIAGWTNDIIVKEKFPSKEEAAKAFEKLVGQIKENKKLI